MKETPGYPENRLDIRVDEQGKITYEQNPVFAQYYAPTREEKEEDLTTPVRANFRAFDVVLWRFIHSLPTETV